MYLLGQNSLELVLIAGLMILPAGADSLLVTKEAVIPVPDPLKMRNKKSFIINNLRIALKAFNVWPLLLIWDNH